MKDFEDLAAWIQPRHLSASGIDAYRAALANHALRVLRITDFLEPDRAASLGQFLSREASFQPTYGLYSDYRVSAEVWRAADEDDRLRTYGMLSGPDPRFRLSPNLFTFLAFRKTLATSAFKAYMSAVTGLSLGEITGLQAHQMRPRHFLKPHNDRIEGRRIAFIFYLAPDWQTDYGGALHITGNKGAGSEIEATFNSLAVFDLASHESHYVTAIRDSAGDQARLTVGGWFYGNAVELSVADRQKRGKTTNHANPRGPACRQTG